MLRRFGSTDLVGSIGLSQLQVTCGTDQWGWRGGMCHVPGLTWFYLNFHFMCFKNLQKLLFRNRTLQDAGNLTWIRSEVKFIVIFKVVEHLYSAYNISSIRPLVSFGSQTLSFRLIYSLCRLDIRGHYMLLNNIFHTFRQLNKCMCDDFLGCLVFWTSISSRAVETHF